MKSHRFKIYLIAVLSFLFFTCRKDEPIEGIAVGAISLQTEYLCNDTALLFDSICFRTEAGELISISKLEFFISDLALHHSGGIFKVPGSFYLNAANKNYEEISNASIPHGEYSGISFILGVDSLHNVPGGLPGSIVNNEMFWPVQMGGGYHFMKLEGKFRDSGNISGYAIHLGKNANVVSFNFNEPFKIGQNDAEFILQMDIMEWFKNPYQYNLDKDGRYTMASDYLMNIIAGNGKDVFKLFKK